MFDYCYECGTKLEIKELEHEGLIPFCPKCKEFRFPIFSSAVNVVILNKEQTKTKTMIRFLFICARSFLTTYSYYIS